MSEKTFLSEKPGSFLIDGPAGHLEIITTMPAEATNKTVAIICHPNPVQQGTMHNKVVTTLAKTFDRLGLATVRFNFRGVGNSEGEHAQTVGETDDCLAVLDWVKKVLPDYNLWLAGFSFGSYIAAKVANQVAVKQLISIAPPVDRYDFTVFTEINCPWLVVMGNKDEIVPPAQVIDWAKNPPSPIDFVLIEEVGHFFHGHLIELRELLIEKLSI